MLRVPASVVGNKLLIHCERCDYRFDLDLRSRSEHEMKAVESRDYEALRAEILAVEPDDYRDSTAWDNEFADRAESELRDAELARDVRDAADRDSAAEAVR